jgi:hypothetical protein
MNYSFSSHMYVQITSYSPKDESSVLYIMKWSSAWHLIQVRWNWKQCLIINTLHLGHHMTCKATWSLHLEKSE